MHTKPVEINLNDGTFPNTGKPTKLTSGSAASCTVVMHRAVYLSDSMYSFDYVSVPVLRLTQPLPAVRLRYESQTHTSVSAEKIQFLNKKNVKIHKNTYAEQLLQRVDR